MNEEFLYRLRAEPPPEFAVRLKLKLDRQTRRSDSTRSRIIRALAAVSLIGASAFAVMSPTVRDKASALVDRFRSADEAPLPAADGGALSSRPSAIVVPGAGAGLPPERSSQPAAPATQRVPASDRAQSAATGDSDSGAQGSARGGVSVGAITNASTRPPRNRIRIVGSTIAHSFTRQVAEEFSRDGTFRKPIVESTETGEGFAQFCEGVGAQHPDIAQASRPIEAREIETCAQNGIGEIGEAKFGYYALTVVSAPRSAPLRLTSRDIFLALVKQVPDPAESAMPVANPNQTWQDVNPSLPALTIEVLGPTLSMERRAAFAELMLHPGCDAYPGIEALKRVDRERYEQLCNTVRDDGAYVVTAEKLTLQMLQANPNALALVGYNFFAAHRDKLAEVPIDGIGPTLEAISKRTYPASRPLYLYVKIARVGSIPGLRDFIHEYVSEKAIGREGYLAGRGLVPLEDVERLKLRTDPLGVRVFNR